MADSNILVANTVKSEIDIVTPMQQASRLLPSSCLSVLLVVGGASVFSTSFDAGSEDWQLLLRLPFTN